MSNRREFLRDDSDDGLMVRPVLSYPRILMMDDRRLSRGTATTVATATSSMTHFDVGSRLEEYLTRCRKFSLVDVEKSADIYVLQLLHGRHLFTFSVPTNGEIITAKVLICSIKAEKTGTDQRLEEKLHDYEASLRNHESLSLYQLDNKIFLSLRISQLLLEYERFRDFQDLVSELVETSLEYSRSLKSAQRRKSSSRLMRRVYSLVRPSAAVA